MITIKPAPSAIDKELLERLAGIESAEIGHLRYWGVMQPRLRPIIPGRRVAGTAVTLAVPSLDSSMIPHALGLARPGDILVIDRLGDRTHACLGGVVALAAKLAGVVAMIVDGFVTDFSEIRDVGLPIWCRGEAALMTKLLAIGGAINIPVSCGGAAVLPGDAILADDSGVCVLPADEIEPTISAVLAGRVRREPNLRRIQAGEKLGLVNGVSARINAALGVDKR
jgi:4-hydroxy-4-methyl-2-oxoglutarate aldolase